MTDPSHVVIERCDQTTVVLRLVGEFDMSSVDLLRSAFSEAIDASTHHVVIDLSATSFLDSMALGAIIGAQRRASGWGGWVRLADARPNIRKVLRLTELDTVFGLFDSVDAAATHVDVHQRARP